MNVTDAIQSSSNSTNSSSSSITNNNSMGKQEFLKLLTVQLQNQNPLSPMDGKDFSAQLAQFSQVEQLENINSGISSSNELDLQLTRSITNSLSTTMVGKEAKVAGNDVIIDQNDQGTVSFELDNYAKEVKIKINDSNGDTVKTINKQALKSGEHTLNFDEAGLDFSNKEYTFEVQATDGANQVGTTPMMIGTVSSVRFNEKGSYIVMDGAEASFSSVLEIAQPE